MGGLGVKSVFRWQGTMASAAANIEAAKLEQSIFRLVFHRANPVPWGRDVLRAKCLSDLDLALKNLTKTVD